MIHIVGLGGIGFWLTTGLIREFPDSTLCCWDKDTLSNGMGYRRLPAGSPTTRKTELLQEFLVLTLGESVPTLHYANFTGNEALHNDIVIDCTDMPVSKRRLVWGRVKERGAHILRVSYDGHSSIVVVSSGLPISHNKTGGYAEIPTLALSLAAGGIGAEIVRLWVQAIGRGERPFIDYQITLKDVLPNVLPTALPRVLPNMLPNVLPNVLPDVPPNVLPTLPTLTQ